MKLRLLYVPALLAISASVHAATLFDQLGGEPRLRSAVDQFVSIMLDDDRINFRVLPKTDLDKFKGLLYDELCELSAGPLHLQGARHVLPRTRN